MTRWTGTRPSTNPPTAQGGGLLQRATMEKEDVESPTMEMRMEVSAKADPDRVSEGGLV